jgi:hypothetical protein
MGVRLHKDDFWIYLIEWGLLLGVLGLAIGMIASEYMRKHRIDPWKVLKGSKDAASDKAKQ